MAIEKIKILGAVLEHQHCRFGQFGPILNGLDWQCCLAGSSKTAPRILIFFNCPGCRISILCEIHCYLYPHIFWVHYFSLSQYIDLFKLHLISWKYPFINYLGHDLNDLEILLRSRRRSPWSFGFQTYHWECDKKTRSRYSDFWHHLAASWNNNISKCK